MAGDLISGSLTFQNTTLTNLGFTLDDSGTFSGNGNTVNFNVTPEPSTAAMICLALAFAIVRKNRCR